MSVLVVGAGVSGLAAARLARRQGERVVLFDESPDSLDHAAAEGFETIGPEWSPDLAAGTDTIVVSPGIPPHSDVYRDCAGAISEIEYAYRHSSIPVVAVTGTNGKTTVTGAIASLLAANGSDAVACGNIGLAYSDVADGDHDVLVVEVSSFQLYSIVKFRPRVSVLLNVAPDHLDWHGSFEAYAAAKGRITENQTIDDLCVANKGDKTVRELVAFAAARVILVEPTPEVEVGGGLLALPAGLDTAYQLDLVAAIAAAGEFGITREPTQEWLNSFEFGAHRRQQAGSRNGVDFVNDSKATNPHAAVAAIEAFASVVLIAGGRNKGLDLSALMEAAPRYAVLIGEAADELEDAAGKHSVPSVRAASLTEAVAKAAEIAVSGDTVLLAPGCTSFDMFENYEVRGEAFMAAVRALVNEDAGKE